MAQGVQKRQLPVYITCSDVHRMLACCGNPRDAMLIELLFNSGGRISEVLALRAGDITKHGAKLENLKQGMWRKEKIGIDEVGQDVYRKTHISVREEKHVFLNPEFLTRLKNYCKGLPQEAFVIRRLGGVSRISRKRAWEIVTKVALEAGILRRRFGTEQLRPAWCHCLRHSNAVNLLEHGVPISIIAANLGHASLSSTQVYSKFSDPRTAELISQVKF